MSSNSRKMFDLGALCRLCAIPAENAFDGTLPQNQPLSDAVKTLYNVEVFIHIVSCAFF